MMTNKNSELAIVTRFFYPLLQARTCIINTQSCRTQLQEVQVNYVEHCRMGYDCCVELPVVALTVVGNEALLPFHEQCEDGAKKNMTWNFQGCRLKVFI